jgi:hypothetical protein
MKVVAPGNPFGSSIDTGEITDLAITNSKIADSTIASGKLAFGMLEKIADTEVTGSAVTTVSFTGLDLDSAKAYIIIAKFTNPTINTTEYKLYFNGDTTDTNYYYQYILADGATVSSGRSNSSRYLGVEAGEEVIGFGTTQRDPAGYVKSSIFEARRDPATVLILQTAHTWLTQANVTQMDFTSSVAGAIGVGSRIMIFKVSQ